MVDVTITTAPVPAAPAKLVPTVEDRYPDLAAMSPSELIRERHNLVTGVGSYSELTEEQLFRLSAVLALLRKGTSGPPKAAKTAKPTLEDVL